MRDPDFTIKRGDVGKAITGQFQDADGNAVDVTGYSLPKFYLRKYVDNTVVINGATFTITNAAQGRFSYSFISGDLTAMTPSPRADAFFKGEFKLTVSGAVMTFPTDPDAPFLIIKLEDDLS